MKTNIISFILLILALTACTSAQPVDVQGTAVALAVTEIHLTQSLLPTPTPTATATIEFILPTPYPTQPHPPIFTPDATQVERWKEYQAELSKIVLSSNLELGNDPATYENALCEWDILGQSSQAVYVYVVCVIAKGNGGMRTPAIIYLEKDGSIQKVQLPESKDTNSEMFDYASFPIYVQEKFCYYFDPFPSDLPPCPFSSTYPRPRLDKLYAHLEYRKAHPEEPPLIVLSATPTP